MKHLRGSITALVTPFRNGSVDEQAFRGHPSGRLPHLQPIPDLDQRAG